jgi:hypothetical protein
VSATAITAIVPAWTGIGHDEVDVVGDRADHVQGDDRDADRAQLVGRRADVAAHDRAGEHEQPGRGRSATARTAAAMSPRRRAGSCRR